MRVLLALLAVCCVGAVTASGALAASKKGELVNEKGGALVKSHFTGQDRSEITIQTGTGTNITCTGASLAGSMTSTKAGTATLTLKGCTHGESCKTNGAINAGEWILPAKLAVSVEKGTERERDVIVNELTEVGLKCGTIEANVRGGFAFPVSESEKLSTSTFLEVNGETLSADPLQIKFQKQGAWESLKLWAGLETTFEEKMEFI